MVLTSGYLSLDILAIFILTILAGYYTYYQWCFKYWERKGMPYTKPTFPFGSLNNPFAVTKSIGEQWLDFYTTSKSRGYKHLRIYTFSAPVYIPIDIELVKNIMQHDFDHFVDRGAYFNEVDDPLSANLFFLEGAKWRDLRVKLTPTFTSGKMKLMFPTLGECGCQLKEAMNIASEKNEPINIKDFAAGFTTNVIGSCAFGIECNCFKDKDSEFIKHGKRVFVAKALDIFKGFFGFACPNLARRLRLAILPKEVTNFFMKIVKETVDYRERNNVVRTDFIQLLIDIKNNVKNAKGNGIGLTFEELAAQAYVFFIAGFETSSTTMTFCLFELASNPDIQQKVRKEIGEVLAANNGEMNYDALAQLKYMGQVTEGLRFGVMQAKVGLTVLLQNYRFLLNEKTKTPLKMDPSSFIMSAEGDIWLNAEKLKK